MLYNIALLPRTSSSKFVELASPFVQQANYLLGNNSFPHVTITMLFTQDASIPDKLWLETKQIATSLNISNIILEFNKTNYKNENDYIWLELLPKFDQRVYDLHFKLVKMLAGYNILCLNASLINYHPHLTIAKIKEETLVAKFKDLNINIIDPSL